MKKTILKFSVLLLGAVIFFSSCVKTEESDEVKALRKAKVEAANLENQKDLIDFMLDTAGLDMQVEEEIIGLQADLADARATLDAAIKDELADASYNPVLRDLLNDYEVFYNGGVLSDGTFLSNGIFDLTSDNLSLQAEILTLKTKKDSISTLIEQYRLDSITSANSIANYTSIINNYNTAKTNSGLTAAIASAQSLLNTSTVNYEKLSSELLVLNAEVDAALTAYKYGTSAADSAAKLIIYNDKVKLQTAKLRLKNNAEDVRDDAQDALDDLNSNLTSIDSKISTNETLRNDETKTLNTAKSILSQLRSGYFTNTGEFVQKEIDAKEAIIAYNNVLIAKYQAKADALKTKIDAQ